MAWEGKEGRRVALGSNDGKLYIYDIGDMGTTREADWVDFQRTLGVLANRSAPQAPAQT
jgi:dynein intermediate chain